MWSSALGALSLSDPVQGTEQPDEAQKCAADMVYENNVHNTPSDTAEARRVTLTAFDAALRTYYNGNFTDAQRTFEALSALDPVASIYAKRCATLAAPPLPSGTASGTSPRSNTPTRLRK